jgi:glycosyltransferase involved in cell wall biosynthesis
MKILFISGLYPPNIRGGGELSTHCIAKGLVERGHDVSVITQGKQREEVVVEGVKVFRLPIELTAKPLMERRHAKAMARVIRGEIGKHGEFDIIHAHDYKSAEVLFELKLANSVVTVRDYAPVCGTTNNMLWDGGKCTCSWRDVLLSHRVVEASGLRKLGRIFQYKYNIGYRRRVFKSLQHQIFISNVQQQEITEQLDLSEVNKKVIYNPISKDYLTKAINKNSVNGNVLYVGTVEMYKGVELLLQAWREVAQELSHVKLKIVGDGAQRVEYEKMVEKWGLQYRVVFTGRVAWNRLRKIYDETSVVVAPHIWVEPFGRTVIEGMSREKIVVAADVGGPAEIIESGKSGLLFKRQSIDDLAFSLKTALTLPDLQKREMQRAARSWVVNNISQENIAGQYEEFYKGVTSRKL